MTFTIALYSVLSLLLTLLGVAFAGEMWMRYNRNLHLKRWQEAMHSLDNQLDNFMKNLK